MGLPERERCAAGSTAVRAELASAELAAAQGAGLRAALRADLVRAKDPVAVPEVADFKVRARSAPAVRGHLVARDPLADRIRPLASVVEGQVLREVTSEAARLSRGAMKSRHGLTLDDCGLNFG